MSDYRPPVDDLAFVLKHIANYDDIAALPGLEHADFDTVHGLLEEAGAFISEVVAPLNVASDKEGSQRQPDGSVKTPTGFKDAYRKYVDAGWGSLPFTETYGGGNFPWAVGLAIQEMLTSASMGFALCPLLTQGAIDAILAYGSEEQKQTYLPKMISGEWTGTMNLTEPHAGTDVGALTTKAVKRDDGTYSISGQKIFISYGEHDLAEQIVHLVLARTPDAPAGTKGISCFIVPKYHVNDDGSPGEKNGVKALSLEHKLGIHGSPTCVLEYDDATGYLIGEENMGMRIMFIMMNNARLSVGLQGVALAERAYQASVDYAVERIQGRAIGAQKDSPIIDFPDVRRMLMTQKATIAAMRRLMYLNAGHMDVSHFHPDEKVRERASEIVGLLTPICKGWGTDMGFELTSTALQVFGGMGYIEETGVAQHLRDVRITAIYEGTNGAQAADLVGRKLGVRNGSSVLEFLEQVGAVDAELEAAGDEFASIRSNFSAQFDALGKATKWMFLNGPGDPNAVLAGSSPYQRMWGLVLGGWLMARSALAARGTDRAEQEFVLAKFYAEQILPQASGLLGAVTAGADDLFALDAKQLGAAV
ncbi:MAG TPA: acyl-CoA dehydrogenase [Terrimesophilobacter sp.]|nr:acyl-CoA dehydrogenase [Terrimesophilobacter sp.]